MRQTEYSGRDNLEVMEEAINYNKFLLDLILLSAEKNDLLVDFGAGNGAFSFPLSAIGYRVICVETDPVLSIEIAKHGLTVLNDLEQVEDESISYLYSLNVLEHIENDSEIMALWYRKLRPGGKMIVYVPAFQILFSSMDRKVGHVRRYSKVELCRKLCHAGFEITESRYADSIGFIATLIYKWIGRKDGAIDPKMLKIYDHWIFPFSRLLDVITYRVWGKNVYARAVKPANTNQ